MEIADGDTVEVAAGGVKARVAARVTPFIHPEAVFTVHGFGRTVPLLKRAFGVGFADQRMAKGCLEKYDLTGGGIAYLEASVTVRKAAEDEEIAA